MKNLLAIGIIGLFFLGVNAFTLTERNNNSAATVNQNPVTIAYYTFIVTGHDVPRNSIVAVKGPTISVPSRGARAENTPIVLEVNYGNGELARWFAQVSEGNVQPRTLILSYYTSNGTRVTEFTAINAWPNKWKIKEDPVTRRLTEEYEFVYEDLTRSDIP